MCEIENTNQREACPRNELFSPYVLKIQNNEILFHQYTVFVSGALCKYRS